MKNSLSLKAFWAFLFALAMVMGACTKTNENIAPNDSNLKLKTGTTITCPASEFTLWGGNGTAEANNTGTLKVTNDGTNIYVEFTTKEGFPMQEVQVWVGCNVNDVPNTSNEDGVGTPIPGQFPYKLALENATYAKVTIPLSEVTCLTGNYCGQSVYVFAHAASTETLWGGNISFLETLDTNRWGWYSQYSICCPTEEEVCDTETAFGGDVKGAGKAWWYYYTNNGLEQKIFAGKTTEVGTVQIVDGVATITLNEGWKLQDVSESVKIQGYETLPSSRPSAGLFTTYKGSDLVDINVGTSKYFVIHLDVKNCYMVPVVY